MGWVLKRAFGFISSEIEYQDGEYSRLSFWILWRWHSNPSIAEIFLYWQSSTSATTTTTTTPRRSFRNIHHYADGRSYV